MNNRYDTYNHDSSHNHSNESNSSKKISGPAWYEDLHSKGLGLPGEARDFRWIAGPLKLRGDELAEASPRPVQVPNMGTNQIYRGVPGGYIFM